MTISQTDIPNALADLDNQVGPSHKRAVAEISKSLLHHLENAERAGDAVSYKRLSNYVDQLEAKSANGVDMAQINRIMGGQSALPPGAMDRAVNGWEPQYYGQTLLKNRHMPLLDNGLDEMQMKGLFEAGASRQSFSVQTKTTASDFTGQLAPYQVPQTLQLLPHEGRLADYLPTAYAPAPVISYLEHQSTTGSAATVAPATLKPNVVFNTVQKTVTATKIAAYASTTTESWADFANWREYFPAELQRNLVDAENHQIISGSGTGTDMLGLLNTTGIISVTYTPPTAPATTPTEPDVFGTTIAAMRSGSALATCNLMVMHPNTFWNVKLTHTTLNNYVTESNVLDAPVDRLWGSPVVVTTAIPQGTALLMDTNRFGRLWVRTAPFIFTDAYSQATSNIINVIVEERCVIAVERPAAIAKITGLS